MTRRVFEKLCTKKVCVDFLAPSGGGTDPAQGQGAERLDRHVISESDDLTDNVKSWGKVLKALANKSSPNLMLSLTTLKAVVVAQTPFIGFSRAASLVFQSRVAPCCAPKGSCKSIGEAVWQLWCSVGPSTG